ncbi:hypothetical protein [Photobacterium sanguinicancri]|uniref:hypothetical protein n=1 Tax=Photobacterium sanguinicancri TaxID=875932 RepID=UPI0021C3D6C2|nr:hypothetical protein [Photobacterium sanguinicancri]
MKELTTILKQATNQIESSYFHLELDGGDPVYRERVYCYELYHQMRKLWPTNTSYYLNGEVDKSAHPKLERLKADHIKPDFLVHQPGNMRGNHAIIEVKTQKAQRGGVKKDLQSLSDFKNIVGYERAIYLIYGYGFEPEGMTKWISEISKEVNNLASIELWYQISDSAEAFQHCTIEPTA